MNKREVAMSKPLSLILALILLFCAFTYAVDPASEKLLTANDVEQTTGLQGIKLIPRNPVIGAGGDLNFALQDNTMILTVAIQDSSMYERWKGEEGFFHSAVSGIGDEAFNGPSFGEHRYVLIFRKGKTAVSLSSFINMKAGGEPYLNQEKLQALARIMISRI
jgi:hypothetical protein